MILSGIYLLVVVRNEVCTLVDSFREMFLESTFRVSHSDPFVKKNCSFSPAAEKNLPSPVYCDCLFCLFSCSPSVQFFIELL